MPLFQRSYVWTVEDQLGPLWSDCRRLTELRMRPGAPAATHFLGAVVLQQQLGGMGAVGAFSVIDGQQRLTTLQLLMDATAEVLGPRGDDALAQQLFTLTHNPSHFGLREDELLKVQHTNKDRAAFHEVMNAPAPVEHEALVSHGSLIAKAHEFFVQAVSAWLEEGQEDASARAGHLVGVLSRGLQLVTITLQPDENSQEIFETLNARGTPLTAADLIKNLVFQRIESEGGSPRRAYAERWSLFEDPFWEREIAFGRFQVSRISLFLNHWLVARTSDEVALRSTFTRFKAWTEHETDLTMSQVLDELHAQAVLYQQWIESASRPDGDIDDVALFVYRTQAAGTEVVKPVLLWLHDVRRRVPEREQRRALAAVQSWVLRRSMMRLPNNDLSRTVAGLIQHLSGVDVNDVGARTEEFLTRQQRRTTYWPGDDAVRQELRVMPVYRRLPRALTRVLLEAVEDAERGYLPGQRSKTGARVTRNSWAIEHLLPQRWRTNWPVDGLAEELYRDEHVHRLGNLALLTSSLNSSVSNAAWPGLDGKQAALNAHDVSLMTRTLRRPEQRSWTEEDIDKRTDAMIDLLLQVWPVPTGHAGEIVDALPVNVEDIGLRELLDLGLLHVGDTLVGRTNRDRTAIVGEQGILVVDGHEFPSPSSAAKFARGRPATGWWYWLLPDGRALRDLKVEAAQQPRP